MLAYMLDCNTFSDTPVRYTGSSVTFTGSFRTRHFLLQAITEHLLYSTYHLTGITCNFTQTFH